MSQKPLIVFDFDGTLVNSVPDYTEAAQKYAHDIGFTWNSKQDLIDMAMGDAFQAHIIEQQTVHNKYLGSLYDGITDMLCAVKEKYDIAIVTLRDYKSTLYAMRFHGIHDITRHIRTRCCARKNGYGPKPDPASLACLVAETCHRPQDIIVIGDTKSDTKMASDFGAYSVGVLWGGETVDSFQPYAADIYARHPSEIPDIIKILFNR